MEDWRVEELLGWWAKGLEGLRAGGLGVGKLDCWWAVGPKIWSDGDWRAWGLEG